MDNTSGNGGIVEYVKSVRWEKIGWYYKKAVDYGVVDVIVHPFDFADTLIRLGYEPFPPTQEPRLFSRNASLVLPGLVSYVQYIYAVDGACGLYRAVVPYVTGNLIYRHLSDYIMTLSPYPADPPEDEPHLVERFTRGNIDHFVQLRVWKLVSNVVGLHVAYPFHVVAVRTMARFVTTNATPEGYRPEIGASWIDEIRHLNGFSELFAGLQAKVLREIVFTLIASTSFMALIKLAQILKADRHQAEKLESSIEYIGNSFAIVYVNPFRNVADIMMVNKTDIPLGSPPFNDHFASWWDCMITLRNDRKWKTSSGRGLFQFGRQYNGPLEIVDGRLIPKNTHFGPMYMPSYARGLQGVPNALRDYYAMGLSNSGRLGKAGNSSWKPEVKLAKPEALEKGVKLVTLSSERAPLDIMGMSGNNFYLYHRTNNPFGL